MTAVDLGGWRAETVQSIALYKDLFLKIKIFHMYSYIICAAMYSQNVCL